MKDLFIVDGYNVIFAWDDLKCLAKESLEHARERLINTLASYGKAKGYDAMYTEETEKSMRIGRDCEIVYTDKDETADSRIERLVYEHRNDQRHVYVATSDGPEQNQILGTGAYRIPARELRDDVERTKKETEAYASGHHDHKQIDRNEVVYRVKNKDVLEKLEKIRRSKR